MALNADDVKKLAESTLVPRLYERLVRLTDERLEVLRNKDTTDTRLQEIDNELAGLEARLKQGASAVREVLDKIDPPRL